MIRRDERVHNRRPPIDEALEFRIPALDVQVRHRHLLEAVIRREVDLGLGLDIFPAVEPGVSVRAVVIDMSEAEDVFSRRWSFGILGQRGPWRAEDVVDVGVYRGGGECGGSDRR